MTSYASVRKDFLRYTSLNILGMIGLSVYILADTFFISRGLGSDGLAALNLAIPVYSFIHGTGLMLGMGGATRYSIFKAQNDFQKSNQIFTNTLYTAGIFSAFYFLLGLFFSEILTEILGADTVIFQMTHTYLKVILLFSPAFILNNIIYSDHTSGIFTCSSGRDDRCMDHFSVN